MHSGFCSPKNLHHYNDCYDWMVSNSAQAPLKQRLMAKRHFSKVLFYLVSVFHTFTEAKGHHWCCCFLLGLQECLCRFSRK